MSLHRVVAQTARRQGGVLTRADLRTIGLSDRAVDRWVAGGRLHRLYPGVFSIGHDLLPMDSHRRAVVLAVGHPCGLGFQSAAAMWGIASDDPKGWHVVRPVGSSRGQRLQRITVHRSRSLTTEDLTSHRGIPVTTVARTLVDLASVLDERPLLRAIHEAEVIRKLDVAAVNAVLERSAARKGTGILRKALAAPESVSSEEFVDRFLQLCALHRLPTPEVSAYLDAGLNALTEGDIYFRRERLIVELDGSAIHMTRQRFESDRRRDAALLARDIVTMRVTWQRLSADGAGIAGELQSVLDRRRVQFQTPGV